MTHSLIAGLTLAVLAASAGPALAAPAAQCTLEYDAQARALVLRYAGADVSFDTQYDAEGVHVVADFTRAVSLRVGSSVQVAMPFASWQQHGDRVVLTYKRPYNVIVEDSPLSHMARLVNLAAPSAAQLAALPVATPMRAIAVAPRVAEPMAPTASATPGATTFTVAGRLPLAPAAEPERPAVVGAHPPVSLEAPSPSPEPAVRVAPSFLPPTPAPTPEAPTVPPVAIAPPALPALTMGGPAVPSLGGLARGEGFAVAPSFGLSSYQETYAAGDVAVQAASVMMPGLWVEGRGRLPVGPAWLQPDWFGTARLDFANYAFRDTLFPLSTHSRQTWRTELSMGKRFAWNDLRLDAGAAYMVRWESTLHSAVAPEPSYAFATGRLLHGPEFTLAGSWHPSQPTFLADWGASADVGFAPYVFNRVDGGAGPLPALTGLQLSVGIERWLAGHRIRAGYQRWSLGAGSQYDEVFQGPFVSIH